MDYFRILWNRILSETRFGNRLYLLLLFLTVVFFVIRFPFWLNLTDVANLISSVLFLPGQFASFIQKPWTLFTQLICYNSFSLFVFAFSGLALFGQLFNSFFGKEKLIPFFVFSGLFGGIGYLVIFNSVPYLSNYPENAYLQGSLTSVLAMGISTTLFAPNFKIPVMFAGNVKLKYIFIFFVVLDLLYLYPQTLGWHAADLGGLLFGISFYFLNKKISFKSFRRKIFNKKPPKFEYVKKPISDDEYNRQRAEKQKRIDAILDKISAHGYDSLTKEEKEFLFKSGKNQ